MKGIGIDTDAAREIAEALTEAEAAMLRAIEVGRASMVPPGWSMKLEPAHRSVRHTRMRAAIAAGAE
ncbi:MAG: hypothetical protein LAT81_14550 [Oceanicaulis sp.]|nr:hypothetical protein [Oceanicaulis sp.]